jgi:hypothetical protein
LRRLDGVKTARAQGFRNPEKFFFDVELEEKAVLLPAHAEALAKKLEDYPYLGLSYREIPGTVGPGATFTARGSGQKFDLAAAEGFKGLPAAGPAVVALSGRVTQPKEGLPRIEVEAVRELK